MIDGECAEHENHCNGWNLILLNTKGKKKYVNLLHSDEAA